MAEWYGNTLKDMYDSTLESIKTHGLGDTLPVKHFIAYSTGVRSTELTRGGCCLQHAPTAPDHVADRGHCISPVHGTFLCLEAPCSNHSFSLML